MNRIGCRNARALRGALCVRFVCALHAHCTLREAVGGALRFIRLQCVCTAHALRVYACTLGAW